MSDDTLHDELIHLTTDLIRFESTADRPDQLAAAIAYIEHYLAPLPGLYMHRSTHQQKPALVVTLHDTRTPALMLNGHVDVIPAAPALFDPQVRKGRIYGRASQDMKGSVAVLMRLLKELAMGETRPDVGVQFVSDEELGGDIGTGRLLQEGWQCDFFISAEPTSLKICHEQKGILWLEITLRGESTHASWSWRTRNPIHALAEGISKLIQHTPAIQNEEDSWYTTITPTVVQASSDSINQTPEQATLKFDIRYVAEDNPDEIIATVQSCFPQAEITVLKRAVPLATSPETQLLQQFATCVQTIQGTPAIFYRENYGSDARFYSHHNIPAICFGPTGKGMHADEEWVDIDSLVSLYQIFLAYCNLIRKGK
jgi:succinyl-diaminopimelate desuccinylase